ncbi:MAG: HipA N-terminal domain-containing protein [Eubacteriales bacterium]|nr:HipA N-terminal domain-containing protein [Eubacteriales bacterium]
MEAIYRKGYVYVQNKYAGLIEETDEGYRFSYDRAYLAGNEPLAVSLSLPLRDEPYEASALFPFFDGLIPEGWLMQIAVHNWKIDGNDRFGLLLAACRDCIGDVSVRNEAV